MTENSTNNSDSDIFKIPSLLPDKIPVKLKSPSCNDEPPPPESKDSVETGNQPGIIDEKPAVPSIKPSEIGKPTKPIPYNEPSWGGQPDIFYSLEEIKSGASLRHIPLDQRSFFCFGRLDNCHVVMAHPTISRYHAVLQYRPAIADNDENKGFYLYDMGSTHGTFLNKSRIPAKTYIKVQVGHMIKFGSSTRFFLLHGPEDDQEEESKYTYTQLCEMRKEELDKRQQQYLEDQEKSRLAAEEAESKGIDWGISEDADAETDLTENPFAQTTDEDLYIDDPKKALRCWFEREGEEFRYKVEEKGYGQFRCSIELPIENAGGGCIIAEAMVSGKKKEAVYQCALEACRILDRNGLLRQTQQESKKRKLKNWEEDDYYDSDEDNFFDRTGDLETKRKQRMKQAKKSEPEVDTYETLVEKHKNVLKEIESMERKLNTMLINVNRNKNVVHEDSVEAFTSTKSSGQIVDKLEMRMCRNSLNALKADEDRLRKLINFVKPIELPEIPPLSLILEEEYLEVEEEKNKTVQQIRDKIKNVSNVIESPILEVNKEQLPQMSSNNDHIIPNPLVESSIQKKPDTLTSRPIPRRMSSSKKSKEIAKCFSNQNEEDFNNIVWTPPCNQTGDGRTQLNDKLGY